jgi:catalase
MKEEHMPLPSDEKIVQLANDLLGQFDTIFGLHPGFRPAHAKGMMLSGTFTSLASTASSLRMIHCSNCAQPFTC